MGNCRHGLDGKGAQHLTTPVNVRETIILEGELVSNGQDREPPIARIRVTDAQGRYFPPLSQPSGLIRMISQEHGPRGERWAYADGKFQVRVPAGKIRVSIRRGLEYRSRDEEIEITAGDMLSKKFVLSRWAHMEKDGWYPGDMHVHMLDPATALFESRAEGLHFVNVMVFKHLEDTYAREHFTGGVDPVSDHDHYIYYNEEFRNEPMGHVGLINLKKLVEPVSTGRLGFHWPTIMRYQSLNMQLPLHGDAHSPDFPLLVQAMREAHKQPGSPNEGVLLQVLRDVHVLGVRSKTKITKAVLESAPELLVVGAYCIGVEHIDLPSCTARRHRCVP